MSFFYIFLCFHEETECPKSRGKLTGFVQVVNPCRSVHWWGSRGASHSSALGERCSAEMKTSQGSLADPCVWGTGFSVKLWYFDTWAPQLAGLSSESSLLCTPCLFVNSSAWHLWEWGKTSSVSQRTLYLRTEAKVGPILLLHSHRSSSCQGPNVTCRLPLQINTN